MKLSFEGPSREVTTMSRGDWMGAVTCMGMDVMVWCVAALAGTGASAATVSPMLVALLMAKTELILKVKLARTRQGTVCPELGNGAFVPSGVGAGVAGKAPSSSV